MNPILDKQLRKVSNVVWQMVEKDGQKWTLQVQLLPGVLDRLVGVSIEEKDHNHSFAVGPLMVYLTRQL